MTSIKSALLIFLSASLIIACGSNSQRSEDAERGPLAKLDPALQPEPKPLTLYKHLQNPWGMDFLPDGRILVTQKGGSMVLLSSDGMDILGRITPIPRVDSSGQGGLLDVAVDPDFDTNPWIYWVYSEYNSTTSKTETVVAKAKLIGTHLLNYTVIYRQSPLSSYRSSSHFGSRLTFANDKTLFITLGDRRERGSAQNLSTPVGKIIRINRDGSPASGNPDLKTKNALPEIWSYGHRNPQGAALHPETRELWISEHGPQGGDEINRIQPGANYGWPVKSYGCEYSAPTGEACRIGGGTHAPDYSEPVSTWTPTSTAPSGMTFYTGTDFPEWKNNLFVGALRDQALWRIVLDGNKEIRREKLFADIGDRIRDVNQGPDGKLYLLTDGGKLMKVVAE